MFYGNIILVVYLRVYQVPQERKQNHKLTRLTQKVQRNISLWYYQFKGIVVGICRKTGTFSGSLLSSPRTSWFSLFLILRKEIEKRKFRLNTKNVTLHKSNESERREESKPPVKNKGVYKNSFKENNLEY